jgi:hypothetical protein
MRVLIGRAAAWAAVALKFQVARWRCANRLPLIKLVVNGVLSGWRGWGNHSRYFPPHFRGGRPSPPTVFPCPFFLKSRPVHHSQALPFSSSVKPDVHSPARPDARRSAQPPKHPPNCRNTLIVITVKVPRPGATETLPGMKSVACRPANSNRDLLRRPFPAHVTAAAARRYSERCLVPTVWPQFLLCYR